VKLFNLEIKNMIAKTKIGVAALVVVSFIVGGFAFNAYQVDAFGARGNGYMFGFFNRGFDLTGLEKDSPEWQAKINEYKAEREANMEERKAEMGVWKDMTPEERQKKMEEMRANMPENSGNIGHIQGFGVQKTRGLKNVAGCLFGFMGFRGFGDEVNYEVENLDNGVQITITSDNADIVQKLKDSASRINGSLSE
jgi:hypothetical protein